MITHGLKNGTQAILRAATAEDVPAILKLIHELAEFEELESQVVATEAQLKQNLFGATRFAEVLLCEFDAKAIGFALFFHSFSTFLGQPGVYLEDLYIQPSYRGNGLGTVLLKRLAQVAAERGCGRLEWSVLDWNQSAIELYENLGAKPLGDWIMYRLTGDALAALGKID
jgi:GNAT superfamily N-acetyltransferase